MNIFWVMVITVFLNGDLLDAGLLAQDGEDVRFTDQAECVEVTVLVPKVLADYYPPNVTYNMECVQIEEFPKGGANI